MSDRGWMCGCTIPWMDGWCQQEQGRADQQVRTVVRRLIRVFLADDVRLRDGGIHFFESTNHQNLQGVGINWGNYVYVCDGKSRQCQSSEFD
jgi:hypothetical protein